MDLLHIAEIVHWVALGFMIVVYTARLVWLMSFTAGKDRQKRGEKAAENGATLGAIYSLGNIAMPWAMESTRKGFPFYLSFALFHIGVTAGIGFAFGSSLLPSVFEIAIVGYICMTLLGVACLISILRIVRRLTVPVMRLISTPDDIFAVFTLAVWFATGVLAQGYYIGLFEQEIFLTIFLLCTSFFLVYVPFSKISHYLYYPFTRWYIGKTLGHRGSLQISRVKN